MHTSRFAKSLHHCERTLNRRPEVALLTEDMLGKQIVVQSQKVCARLRHVQVCNAVSTSKEAWGWSDNRRGVAQLLDVLPNTSLTTAYDLRQVAAPQSEHTCVAIQQPWAYTLTQCASTEAQSLRVDPTAGPRLNVDAPLPRFVPQSGSPEQTRIIQPPVAIQQAIDEVKVILCTRKHSTVKQAELNVWKHGLGINAGKCQGQV